MMAIQNHWCNHAEIILQAHDLVVDIEFLATNTHAVHN